MPMITFDLFITVYGLPWIALGFSSIHKGRGATKKCNMTLADALFTHHRHYDGVINTKQIDEK